MEATQQKDEALPQLIGEFQPIDVWQSHINRVFYGLQGAAIRDVYQTFASADYRLAYALAADYVKKVQDREKRGSKKSKETGSESLTSDASRFTPSASPLTVMEWGCGNGNLAACFLDHVKALDTEGAIYPRLRYVLVDGEPTVLDGSQKNPDLKKHADHIQFVQASIDQLGDFPDGSVDRIFCNEFWNELPTKLVLRKSGELQEEHIRPNLKETRLADVPDWSGFIKAFENVDCETLRSLPPFLEDLVWEREYRKIESKDLAFRRIISEFLKEIDEEVIVPINLGAAHSLKEAKRLLAPEAVGFSSFDAGTCDRHVLNDPEKPCYGHHGGQFSFMINFLLLEQIAKYVGGETTIEPQKEFIGRELGCNVMSLMDVLASYPKPMKGNPWEVDGLILKTLHAINQKYESPYSRKISFPLQPETPPDQRAELERILDSLKPNGVPDTIAYVTEEEIFDVMTELEKLGYDRSGLRTMLTAPPQPVDYFHFFFHPLL